ncbi:MAG: cobalt transporter CbiM [Candidatus Abyssobacteria bacterium SURF_5]|uniref:Cobalt transporter CbiM n=1 Tax=Abyssobacteria bacterium (strain SURF_5) TaxID=2093360 RepID=A0A3A4PBK9_ABYX5|nr:MAG: cobalt transporter CbiM [Candidatus Abyssubacteria bacterium SURF_5]
MHISEGVLTAPVLITGTGLTAAGVACGLRKMDYDRIPQVAITASAFFVASLIHVPVGPASMHLVLNGLTGILLGWAAFPAVLSALFLQAIVFQFGGLTTLGVNTFNLALPAVVCYLLFGRLVRGKRAAVSAAASFLAGAAAIALSGILVAFTLLLSGNSFLVAARIIVLAHVPIMIIEGILTMLVVGFLKKVKIEVLEAPHERTHTRV